MNSKKLLKIELKIVQKLYELKNKIDEMQNQIASLNDAEKWQEIHQKFENLKTLLDNLKLDEKLEIIKKSFSNELVSLWKKLSDIDISSEEFKKEISLTFERFKNNLQKVEEFLRNVEKNLSNLEEKLQKRVENLEKLSEQIEKIKKDVENWKREATFKLGIIGPSASGIEVLLDNLKKGVYSKLNFIAGNNITLEVSENKPEGKINLTFHATGGGSGGGISGSGSTGQIAFWTSSNTIGGDNGLFWDNTNKRLGIGTVAPETTLHVDGSFQVRSAIITRDLIVGDHFTGNYVKAIYTVDDETYYISSEDGGSIIRMTSDSPNTVIITSDDDVGLPEGTSIIIQKAGTGDTTIQGDTGVTVRDPKNLATITVQYDMRAIIKIGPNEWVIQ